MSEMAAALGNSGGGIVIQAKDGIYRLSPLTQQIKDQYRAYLKSLVRADITGDRRLYNEEDYHGTLAAFHERSAAGRYDWGDEFCREVAPRLRGTVKLLQLLLADDEDHCKMGLPRLEKVYLDNKDGFDDALNEVLTPENPTSATAE
jgi:hypothetical protein